MVVMDNGISNEAPRLHLRAAPVEGPSLARIADRVLNRPLLLHPAKAEVILHVLQGRLGLDLGPLSPEANRFTGEVTSESRGLYLTEGGTAVVPIIGSLVNRGAWIGAHSGMTSYEGIGAQIKQAVTDPGVGQIVLDIDSPGGEATGMFALADQIRQARQVKPVVAVVNDVAASAAYGLASQASEIVVSETSVVGSIGVVLMHLDRSGQLEAEGVKPTLIYAGAHKVDGNQFGPLPEGVKADLQAEVFKFYDKFVGVVAEGRGERFNTDAARGTEARTFLGDEAVALGLADRVASFETVLNDFTSPQSRGNSQRKDGVQMSTNDQAAPQAVNAGYSEAEMTAAIEDARAKGADDERARISAIVNSEAAIGRERQAMALALNSDVHADAAAKVLEAAPKENAVPTIAERESANEIGAHNKPVEANPSAAWAKAVDRTNKRVSRH